MVHPRRRVRSSLLALLLAWNGAGRRAAVAFGPPPTTATRVVEAAIRLRPGRPGALPAAAVLPRRPRRSAAGTPLASAVPGDAGSLPSSSSSDAGVVPRRFPKKRLAGAAATLLSTLLVIQTRPASSRAIGEAVAALLRTYESSLIVRPLPTKVVTGASLAVLGDSMAQAKEQRGGGDGDGLGGGYDVPRAASFAAFDACYRMFQHVAIPTIVKFGRGNVLLSLLSKLPLLNPTVAFTAALERTFLYQFVLIPFLYYPIFFAFTGTIQGLSPSQSFERARSTFLPCWRRNLLFWIPAQLVMFGLVADRWQIPYACVMGVLWSLILSATAGKAGKE